MIISFTGTQAGMSIYQKKRFDILLEYFKVTEFHEGSCIGADANAHDIALKHAKKIIIHPPINTAKRDYAEKRTKEGVEIIVLPEKDYLDRNKDMVIAGELLIATPKEYKEVLRSGTWSTVRFCKKLKKPLIIIYSDGTYKGFHLKNNKM